jgi:hypothetical protein
VEALNLCALYIKLQTEHLKLGRKMTLPDHHKLYCKEWKSLGNSTKNAVCQTTMRTYYSVGERLMTLVSAAGPHALLLAAITGTLPQLRSSATPPGLGSLAMQLRSPDSATSDSNRTLITDHIIPSLQILKKHIKISIPTFNNVRGLSEFLDGGDLIALDVLSAYFVTNYWSPPVRGLEWFSDQELSTFLPSDISEFVDNGPEPIKIVLPVQITNAKKVGPWGEECQKDKAKAAEWVQAQRKCLSNPENRVRATKENLQSLVKDLYDSKGKLKEDAKFVYIDCEEFQNSVLEFICENKLAKDEDDKKIMLYTFSSEGMRKHWSAKVGGIYDGLMETKKAEDKLLESTHVVHFSWYTRYAPKGKDPAVKTPPCKSDLQHRSQLAKENLQKQRQKQKLMQKSKPMQRQRLARISTEMVEHLSEYISLTEGLESYFHFVDGLTKRYLPKKHRRLAEGLSSVLPLQSQCPFHPHSSCVANIDAMSSPHYDSKDSCSCILCPFGEFEGGELVLWELGLIIKLRPFDILDFMSKNIFHFNLWYSGKRGSLVLQTDGSNPDYHKNHNNWGQCVQSEETVHQMHNSSYSNIHCSNSL